MTRCTIERLRPFTQRVEIDLDPITVLIGEQQRQDGRASGTRVVPILPGEVSDS